MNIQIQRTKLHYLWGALVAFCLLVLPFAGIAQETSGGITGKVTDEKGAPLAGADVIIVHVPSGTTYPVSSEKDGRYRVPGLHPGGPYVVTASMPGLASLQFDNIVIKLGEPLQLNIVLRKGNEQLKEIEIRTTRQRVSANTYGAGEYIGKDRIRSMPAINRSLQDMTRLVPQGSKDNSFGGTNFRYNNVTIDGAINNDAIGFSPSRYYC